MPKTLKVEITVREDDGREFLKTLEGEDAERWSKYVEQVCTSAFIHDANPDWGGLNWSKKEIRVQ
jgi:hypothetical protein